MVGVVALCSASCSTMGVDPVNSARYYQEIEPIAAVVRHVEEDRRAGKTDEQIAADLGWAALQRVLAYLNQPPATQPNR